MKRISHTIIAIISQIILLLGTSSVSAQVVDSTSRTLEEVTIGARRSEGVSRLGGAENGSQIGQDELFRAACCNLGESFVANPSVDVNYNDAAVGARQIKLLGLSGQYVQMLTESIPMATGVATPYLLGYVPGAWMKSIAVSKGTSSVKNGSQSITGQINVEYIKPDDEEGVLFNVYGDSRLKSEANAVANIHLNKHLSTMLLGHYEHDFGHHDENGDTWHDSPAVNQLNLQNRWKYVRGRYIMHAGLGLLDESREGGQLLSAASVPYRVLIDSRRYEAYMKHAYLLNREHNTNLALLASATRHQLGGRFGNTDHLDVAMGLTDYTAAQSTWTSQLMLEHDFSEEHNLSTGLSLTAEYLDETLAIGLTPLTGQPDTMNIREVVPGAYVQYTFKPSYRFTAMAGLRADHSSLYGFYATPRLHLKWMATDWVTLRGSAGKGYRSTMPLAENHYLLSSYRSVVLPVSPVQEEAWNSGLSAAFYIPVGEQTLTVNAEYYYTHFMHQLVVDYEMAASQIVLHDLSGRSFSHTAQVDATCSFSDVLDATVAFRYNHVRCTYDGRLMEKPLQSRYKGLLTLSWKPMMGLWQVDLTLQLNGGGRMPEPALGADGKPLWEREFSAYPQLNLQVTREFRHFSVYVGAENLTGYRQANPVVVLQNAGYTAFDPTLVYGPVHGAMAYAGIRAHLWK